ncbi:MAG: hypothetical protein WCV88_00115 [Patescibacteria group bacterium]|jgi:hypothetical protein
MHNISKTIGALEKLMAVCPHCRAGYAQLDTAIVSENHGAELVHVKCRTCQCATVALLLSTGPLVSSIGLATDLSLDDVAKFRSAGRITEDDLQACHRWFNNKNVVTEIINLHI